MPERSAMDRLTDETLYLAVAPIAFPPKIDVDLQLAVAAKLRAAGYQDENIRQALDLAQGQRLWEERLHADAREFVLLRYLVDPTSRGASDDALFALWYASGPATPLRDHWGVDLMRSNFSSARSIVDFQVQHAEERK